MSQNSFQIIWASAMSDGVNLHRIATPARSIANSIVLPLGFQETPKLATHIVFNSLYTYTAGQQQAMLEYCRSQQLKIILDIDDYWKFQKNHSNYTESQVNNYAEEVQFCIKNADLVWCASKKLQKLCKQLNNNAHYIPNCIVSSQNRSPIEQANRFGYVASANNHLHDLANLQGSLQKIRNSKSNIAIGWCGYQKRCEDSDKMREMIACAGSHFVAEYLPPQMYMWHYKHIDVALAPLEKTEFNRFKSNLKALEAGHMGCALICEDLEPYAELQHEFDCLKVQDGNWHDAIEKLANDKELAHNLAANLQQKIYSDYNIENVTQKRLETL